MCGWGVLLPVTRLQVILVMLTPQTSVAFGTEGTYYDDIVHYDTKINLMLTPQNNVAFGRAGLYGPVLFTNDRRCCKKHSRSSKSFVKTCGSTLYAYIFTSCKIAQSPGHIFDIALQQQHSTRKRAYHMYHTTVYVFRKLARHDYNAALFCTLTLSLFCCCCCVECTADIER